MADMSDTPRLGHLRSIHAACIKRNARVSAAYDHVNNERIAAEAEVAAAYQAAWDAGVNTDDAEYIR